MLSQGQLLKESLECIKHSLKSWFERDWADIDDTNTFRIITEKFAEFDRRFMVKSIPTIRAIYDGAEFHVLYQGKTSKEFNV